MNKDLIKNELRSLMEVISEQQELVLSHEGKIPQIEMDILTGNIRKLYEKLFELNKSASSINTYEAPVPVEQPKQELIAAEKNPEPENSPVAETKITEMETSAATNGTAHMQPEILVASYDEPVVPVVNEIISEPVLPQAAIAKERVREFSKPSGRQASTASLFDDAPTIAGRFHGSPTVIDKIAAEKDARSLAEKLQKHPVADLKKSIGINEKFAFINELFDGDLNAYNEAIEQLNSCDNLTAARETLNNNLSSKYNWSTDGESYLHLKNLLERRFSA